MRSSPENALAFGAVVALSSFACGSGGDVIYDNTKTSTGSTSFSELQIGDEVVAEGRNRKVVLLEIGLTQQGSPGTGDVQARLYANDGPDGAPATLLWESDLMDDVEFTGGFDMIAFAVPSVLVPDLFTWTIQISDTQPVAIGLPHFHPPIVGSSPDHAWFGEEMSWTKLESGDPVNFMARVRALGDACPADLDGCGTVGFADLLQVLQAWGPCPGCPEDIDGSGDVGFSDLVTVLAAWGPCP